MSSSEIDRFTSTKTKVITSWSIVYTYLYIHLTSENASFLSLSEICYYLGGPHVTGGNLAAYNYLLSLTLDLKFCDSTFKNYWPIMVIIG